MLKLQSIFLYFKKIFRKNKDSVKVELGPLKMTLNKIMSYDYPHELSIFIPRVEIREKVIGFCFSKTREIIYNSITIVDAPRAQLSGEDNDQTFPPDFFKEEEKNEI